MQSQDISSIYGNVRGRDTRSCIVTLAVLHTLKRNIRRFQLEFRIYSQKGAPFQQTFAIF